MLLFPCDQVAGSAGRNLFYKTGKLVPRIVGLDPASVFSYYLHSISVQNANQIDSILADPCFNTGEALSGLSRGDASHVLVIHSNSGGLGKRDPIGEYFTG